MGCIFSTEASDTSPPRHGHSAGKRHKPHHSTTTRSRRRRDDSPPLPPTSTFKAGPVPMRPYRSERWTQDPDRTQFQPDPQVEDWLERDAFPPTERPSTERPSTERSRGARAARSERARSEYARTEPSHTQRSRTQRAYTEHSRRGEEPRSEHQSSTAHSQHRSKRSRPERRDSARQSDRSYNAAARPPQRRRDCGERTQPPRVERWTGERVVDRTHRARTDGVPRRPLNRDDGHYEYGVLRQEIRGTDDRGPWREIRTRR